MAKSAENIRKARQIATPTPKTTEQMKKKTDIALPPVSKV